MARKQDDLSLDDELTAAFLNDDADDLIPEQEMVEAPADELVETEAEETAYADEVAYDNQDSEWDTEEELPGQLAVDVYETANKLIVKARTAGIERKDLEVTMSDNILTISGTLNGDDEGVTQWHIQECYWGEFKRTISLPVQVKEEGVEAVLNNGVLTISFEKEKVEAPKRILIN